MARGVGRLLLFATVVVGTCVVPLPSTSAATTICVALVVDFQPLGGGVDSTCTRVPKGANGYQVLDAGHHQYTICQNGIIGEIDDQPDNGCQIKDSTHFWGYWHRKPGSRTWTFSNFGAGGYHPVEGSTEGWVWEDGKTSPPADTPYPAGCHTPPASPTPAPPPSAHSSSPPSSTGGTSQAGATSATGAPSPTGKTSASDGRPRHRASASATASADAQRRRSATATPAAADATPTTTSSASVLSGDPPATSNGGGHLAPLAAALGVAALLGSGAWWRSRRTGSGT